MRYLTAVRAGVIAAGMSLCLLPIDYWYGLLPFILFGILSFIAPFFPKWGYYHPVIYKGCTGKKEVALTFDDGPDPLSTPKLLKLLKSFDVRAAFFVVGKHVEAYPAVIDSIIEGGHEIGNHTQSHDPLMMFKKRAYLNHEVYKVQALLDKKGITPLAFRPPVGIVSPRVGTSVDKCRLYILNFSCRAYDMGNRRIKRIAQKILSRVIPDDIILLHDAFPGSPNELNRWLDEVRFLIEGLYEKGFKIVPLSQLINRPVFIKKEKG